MEAALKLGVQRLTGEVTSLVHDPSSSRITGVRLSDGRLLTADQVLLCTGAWTSALLSPLEDTLAIPPASRIETQLKATGTVSAYYRVSPTEISTLCAAGTPVVVYGGNGEVFPPSHENGLMKFSNSKTTFTNTITTDSGARISVPLQDQGYVPEALKRETEEIMKRKVFPQFAREMKPEFWRVCYDAQTPSEDFLLCRYPHDSLQNLFLMTGGSFHSYKYAPSPISLAAYLHSGGTFC